MLNNRYKISCAYVANLSLREDELRMTNTSTMAFHVNCSVQRRPSLFQNIDRFKTSLSSSCKPLLKELKQLSMQLEVSQSIKNASVKLLDAFVDSMFQFADQPILPSQSNFAPVDELNEPFVITSMEGKIPDDFPEGVYIRNGPNPLFGGLKSTTSMFGKTGHIWIEGEGMLHALYFDKESDIGSWTVLYNSRHVETETFKVERKRNKPSFLPAIEGSSLAILMACLLNMLRFGKVNKDLSNTNVFEHSGKFYSIAENHLPQEIDIFSLQNLGDWDINGTWHRPFTAHPKTAPATGELVVFGVDAIKPYMEVGVVSADGKRLVHKVDLKLNRCPLSHDMGVTESYNVIMDFPLTIDLHRLIKGGPLIKFDNEDYARIGIMPRYGDVDSVRWFEVEPNCTFHILNCFEEGVEVVVRGCRSLESIISKSYGMDLEESEWVSGRLRSKEHVEQNTTPSSNDELLFSRFYEWRLNMETGEVNERNLTGTELCMEFPMINPGLNGLKNKFGYTQIVHEPASSSSGMPKFGGLAKLYFDETSSKEGEQSEGHIKVEHHEFEGNTFCTGSAFVPKEGGVEEDDGWIITFVHDEDTNTSKVYIIDTKNFTSEPVAKITLPCRVPYGFHGAFMPVPIHK
ncbi:carotenoid 9,10(9',10')-cleavage dioxygenase 1-like [Populus alba]|uniref:carotenoid 9,10(9',10')-cleavage dioxygenase 1-like n=1 Tax=Populus alba TaxID=43335 RepID=UPI001588C8AE|nr:carotenoid 9,10(9',10')-cleavage dioxygenase 1-like [Populus alba]